MPEPTSETKSLTPPARPAVVAVLALSAGILIDRWLSPSALVWSALLGAALTVALVLLVKKKSRVLWPLLVLCIVFVGGSYHHRCLTIYADDDVGSFTAKDATLCRLRGHVFSEPVVKMETAADSFASWTVGPSTSLVLKATHLEDDGRWSSCAGLVMVHVTNAHCRFVRGDPVQALGWLDKPSQPMNPGEFDYRRHLAQRRILAVLFCEGDRAVSLDASAAPQQSWARSRDGVRNLLMKYLVSDLDERCHDVAAAVVLGRRSDLTQHELRPYLQSGTLHLLIISGLHLALLSGILWRVTSIMMMAVEQRAVAVLLLIWGYAYLTGGSPPVVRAAVLVSLFLGGFLVKRKPQPLNSIAVAMLLVLLLDPSHMFRGGPQLSFLAVLAIVLFHRRTIEDWLAGNDGKSRPGMARSILAWLVTSLQISTTIWIVSAPLIMHRFHLFTPVSIVLSLAQLPLLAGVLATAPVVIGLNAFAPQWSAPFRAVLQQEILAIDYVAHTAERWGVGYLYVPAPPGWWIAGLYILLLAPWCHARFCARASWYLTPVLLWLGLGVAAAAGRPAPQTFCYDQLSVGHGLCSILRSPAGETVLYDCGSLRGQVVVERTIAPWLWAHQVRTIDGVILSHPDVDHFNGLLRLEERFPIGRVFCSKRFIESTEPPAKELLSELNRRGIPVRLIAAGDQLRLGGTLLTVLQPDWEASHESDNSSSVVVLCESDGSRLLLTGDLEGKGLSSLLDREVTSIDVLAAPHHGSRSSNTAAVARRLQPNIVVCSRGYRRQRVDPLDNYRRLGTLVFSTPQCGAVSCRFATAGVKATSFRDPSR